MEIPSFLCPYCMTPQDSLEVEPTSSVFFSLASCEDCGLPIVLEITTTLSIKVSTVSNYEEKS